VTEHQTIEELATRLERERLEADRLYNAALTAVDRAIQQAPPLPAAPAPYDGARLAELNEHWNLLPQRLPALPGWLNRRIARAVDALIGPAIERQRRFNAALVDHLNRNVRAHESMGQSLAELLSALRREFDALVRFESLLIQQLQTITVYVDSKDRALGGSELRERVALNEARLLALKRTVEQSAPAATTVSASSERAETPFAGAVDAVTYVGFEDRFRGEQADIRRRVEDYLPLLEQATDVVDIGCGRGELLALLAEHHVTARGVDSNPAMVDICRSRELMAEQSDALGFLERQADGTIGGLIAIQVVEHMTPGYLTKFLEAAFHKMRPGAPLILETINPSCWMAFFETYIRDPTHKQPIHPDTLRYLVQAAGFTHPAIQYRSPVAEGDKLDTVPNLARAEDTVASVVRALNDHADKLNGRLFSFMDYVVVARR
jgi:2-polyprenyl-3-methyl-5-hydroxy-6-metoxy-1,4-benzoquinol methylase